jgi:hypothetical protein
VKSGWDIFIETLLLGRRLYWEDGCASRVFPSNEAIFKVLYMAALELEKKWTMPVQEWALIYAPLMILFEGRLP